jgi:F-type H+-transporting ATPase subunit a
MNVVRYGLLSALVVFTALAWAAGLPQIALAAKDPEKHGKESHKSDGKAEDAKEHPKDAKDAHHEHDQFEELNEGGEKGAHWKFIESLGIVFQLPARLSRYMVLELVAAALVMAIYIPLARRIQRGDPPKGAWDNAFESVLTFIRDEVAKPNLGEHDADRYVPFLWTLFLFILVNNLLGMLPWMGSPTANIYMTGALAAMVFCVIHGSAIAKMGLFHYIASLWPHMDVPYGLGFVLKPMIFVIELGGTVIKSGVLAVRLFANMLAGHSVLAVILGFVVTSVGAGILLWTSITVASVAGVVALSLLELFVAFLQAYIFVFLTALFMGMAMHPQH